jgi:alpha-1,2-mannosyltransferase
MNRVALLRLAQACLAGLALGPLVVGSLPPTAYSKDLQQEYLTASAWRDGLSIFTPLADLSARYFPVATDNFPHPGPQPPVLAILSMPLTWLPFPAIVLLWLFINVALLVCVGRWLGLSVLGSLALLAWPPLWCLVYIGQLELLILVLLMAGWRAADAGRDWRAGLWLGLAAAIKLYPAFFLLPFLWRRRVRIVLAAGAVFALSQLGGLLALGRSDMIRYYTEILPSVSAYYSVRGLNAAPYGALLRLLGGAIDVSPLVHAPGAVVPLAVALSLFAFAALLRLAPARAPVATFLLLPTGWYYAVVLALPTMSELLRVPSLRRATLVAAVGLSVPLPLVNVLAGLGARPPMGLLLALQPAGMLGLLALSLMAAR